MSVELGPLGAGRTPESDYLKLLKRMTNLFDRAMGDEGIDARVRDRVVARVLHGTPTPDATPDWAEPLPRDLAIVDMLADAAPEREEPPVNGGASVRRTLDESRPR